MAFSQRLPDATFCGCRDVANSISRSAYRLHLLCGDPRTPFQPWQRLINQTSRTGISFPIVRRRNMANMRRLFVVAVVVAGVALPVGAQRGGGRSGSSVAGHGISFASHGSFVSHSAPVFRSTTSPMGRVNFMGSPQLSANRYATAPALAPARLPVLPVAVPVPGPPYRLSPSLQAGLRGWPSNWIQHLARLPSGLRLLRRSRLLQHL